MSAIREVLDLHVDWAKRWGLSSASSTVTDARAELAALESGIAEALALLERVRATMEAGAAPDESLSLHLYGTMNVLQGISDESAALIAKVKARTG